MKKTDEVLLFMQNSQVLSQRLTLSCVHLALNPIGGCRMDQLHL